MASELHFTADYFSLRVLFLSSLWRCYKPGRLNEGQIS